jgi:hypothetical protein
LGWEPASAMVSGLALEMVSDLEWAMGYEWE